MRKIASITVLSATALLLALGSAQADGNADKVVAKMAEGDVSAICSGGREAITAASKKATTSLAQAGEISGNFSEIGKKAGMQFYKTKC